MQCKAKRESYGMTFITLTRCLLSTNGIQMNYKKTLQAYFQN